ncbi:D-lyxose/D-mannose family sugar isomerase [Chitinophaga alhagiae]|uniref:D-lyxose/D-mannose family sugar isomerase n=1 Tax=Chitinophaga alhagiae TaxID=2203219 RepID=UPI000E5B74AE|nr:D-lyxose/D-mannose family sugar isomerase [Chitinophaga alhagiae]
MSLKRSVINESIEIAHHVIDYFKVKLPDFAYWGPDQWLRAGSEYREVKECMLGWDVTDFGSNDYANIGRVLFTLRNGRKGQAGYPKEYAEKLLIDPEHQRAPAHFHISKREDLICRSGGNILVQLCKADDEGNRSTEQFTIQVDGCTKRLSPNDTIRLKPGMSVCIPPRTIHQFWGEEGTGYRYNGIGYTLSTEISSVCDDWNDNVFLVDYGVRFPDIEEDEARRYYLCHEYPVTGSTVSR